MQMIAPELKPLQPHKVPPFHVGAWRVQPALNRLQDPDGDEHSLEPRLMRLLVLLAEHPGDVLHRDTLMEVIWDDAVVTENSLTNSISELRKLFGDDPKTPRYIETIRGVGYRLVAPTHADPSDATKPGATAGVTLREAPLHRATWHRSRALWVGAGVLISLIVFASIALLPLDRTVPAQRVVPIASMPGVETGPAFSPDGRRVAFSWFHGDGQPADLYVQDLETNTRVRLTDQFGAEMTPTWSPDGRHLAFYAHKETCGIYTLPAIGGPARKLTDTGCRVVGLTWSPDGTWLAYSDVDPETRTRRLYLLNPTSLETHPVTLPPTPRQGDYAPVFSPDGTHLAFRRGRTVFKANLYVLSVFDPRAEPRAVTAIDALIRGHDWTDDGDALVFSAQFDGIEGLWRVALNKGTPQLIRPLSLAPVSLSLARQGGHLAFEGMTDEINLWRYGLDAGDTPTPELLVTSTRSDVYPDIAPDGRRLAFTSNRSGTNEVWISHADGSAPARLTTLNSYATGRPRWSPDGRWIAFESHVDGQMDIFVIDAEGGLPKQLTTSTASDVHPNWSADGRSLYFGSDRSGTWQIWQAPLEGGPAMQRTTQGGQTAEASPDGHTLFFSHADTSGIWMLDLETGSEAPVVDGDRNDWRVRGGRLYFRRQHSLLEPPELHRLDLETRHVEHLFDLPHETTAPFVRWGVSISPDERWLVAARIDRMESDILSIEHFP